MKKKIRVFLLVAILLLFVFSLLYVNQCRINCNCNCMNESICSKPCRTILSLLNINDCPYDDSFGKPIVEEKYISEFKNDKECKVDSDCIVFGQDGSCYSGGCRNNTYKPTLPKDSNAPMTICNYKSPKTCICKDNVCLSGYYKQ